MGNMADLAIRRMVDNMNTQRTVKESMKAGVEAVKRDLGYDQAPMLVRLLVEQVAVCWLQMYQTQLSYTAVMGDSYTLEHAAFLERRLTVTQERYLRSMETLARVRRLMKPVPMQVNIAGQGGQQINTVKPSR